MPTDVTVVSGSVDSFYTGSLHTCVMQAGGLKCWGWNDFRQV